MSPPTPTPRLSTGRPLRRRAAGGPLRLLWRLVALVVALVLAGCGQSTPAAGSDGAAAAPVGAPAATGACPIKVAPIAFAVGGRASAPSPVLTARSREIASTVVDATGLGETSPPLIIVSVDGHSDQAPSGEFASPSQNQIALDNDKQSFLTSFESAVAGTRAASPEADVLAALSTAARAARDPATGPGAVVMLDPGLSTVAPLDFRTPGLLGADPGEIVNNLSRQGALPSFAGETVVIDGVGDVAGPQQPLGTFHDWLVTLYTTIAQRGGAACVETVTRPHSGTALAGVPPVSLVAVPQPTTITPGDLQPGRIQPIVLRNDPVTGFAGNSPNLINEPAAREALRPLADWLKANRTRTASLVGTTARWGDDQGQRDTGQDRARKIAELLQQAGVEPGQLQVDGVGSFFPEYLFDQDSAGGLLAGPANENRSVRITCTAPSG